VIVEVVLMMPFVVGSVPFDGVVMDDDDGGNRLQGLKFK
jgi:hypothetical protein